MKVQRSNSQTLKTLAKPVNVVTNICKYTYNMAPRSFKVVRLGLENGAKIAEEKNLGVVGTFARKSTEVVKSISKDINAIELPVIFSALALPTTPVGGSVVAFGVGCLFAIPSVIKRLATKELTLNQIGEFIRNMSEKDYIQLDEGIKGELAKLKTFTKLRK